MAGRWKTLAAGLTAGLALAGCVSLRRDLESRIPRGAPGILRRMEITGYCACGRCCNWRRSWLGIPVYASGRHAGQRKTVGITASGEKAQWGTIAADTRVYPFGTIICVPGYGYGRVEDTGRDIVGARLDLFFPSHEDALQWGRRKLDVRIWTPDRLAGAAPRRVAPATPAASRAAPLPPGGRYPFRD